MDHVIKQKFVAIRDIEFPRVVRLDQQHVFSPKQSLISFPNDSFFRRLIGRSISFSSLSSKTQHPTFNDVVATKFSSMLSFSTLYAPPLLFRLNVLHLLQERRSQTSLPFWNCFHIIFHERKGQLKPAIESLFVGFFSSLIFQPFARIKIIVQLNPQISIVSALKSIVSNEGILSLWKGTLHHFALSLSSDMLAVSINEYVLSNLSTLEAFSGLIAGVFSSLFTAPFEIIHSQSGKNSFFNSAKLILRRESICGLLELLSPTILHAAVYRQSFFSTVAFIRKHFQLFSHPNLSKSYVVTYLSTTFATLVSYPLEVLKLVVVRKKFNLGPWKSAAEIYRIWGIGGFYHGVPIVLIQSAGVAAGLLVIAVLYRLIVVSD